MPSAHNKNKKMTLAEFYQDRFRSDPYNLLEYFAGELSCISANFGVNWDGTVGRIQLSPSKGKSSKLANTSIDYIAGTKYKGRVGLYAEVHLISGRDANLSVPFISFGAKGGSETDSWNGFQALRDLYDREVDAIISQQERDERQARLAKKAQEREARLAKLAAENAQKEKAMRESVAGDIILFDTLAKVGATVPTGSGGRGPHPSKYAVRKKITKALAACDARVGADKHGAFLALMAYSIDGKPLGLQKIYNQKFKMSAKAKPTDKLFTWGMDKISAHHIIGDLQAAVTANKPLRFVEGFATGCTIHLATGDCVVVCFDAGNLAEVVSLYCRYYPNNPKIVDADNDCWKAAEGKGNTGHLAGLTIAKQFGIKATLPTFEDMDANGKPTDWNDVHCQHPHGLLAVKRKLRSAKCKIVPASKHFDYQLQRLGLVKKEAAKAEALAAINAGMLSVPFMLTMTEVYKAVVASLPPATETTPEFLKTLRSRAQWLINQRAKSAQSFRNFSAETLEKPHVNYEKVQPVTNAEGHKLLPPKVLRKIQRLDGVVIVRAPMASGKTKLLLAPLMRQAERCAYLAHRVSLIADACNRLSERDAYGNVTTRVENYQDVVAAMAPMLDRMGCCINSITHPKFKQFFAGITELLIDEASQTLRHVADGTVDNPVAVLDRLAELIRNADRTVMCDADANDALVTFVEKACPGQQIHIIEMATDCGDIDVLHTTDLMAHQQVLSAAKQGEPVLVADDSAKDGAALALRLRTECEGINVLHVHKDSKGEQDVEAFLADPNGQAARWDVVIYSPAISSGVSIEVAHFKHHVGIFFGSVAPSDAVQMLRRDRTAKRFVVGFHITDYRRETDRDRIFRGRVAADRRALITGTDRNIEWSETDSTVTARWHKTLFDDVWLDATADERKARADFANNMLLIMAGDGYRISRLARDEFQETEAKVAKKAAKAAVTASRHDLILSESTPDTGAAERLMRRDVMSAAEAAQLTRYHIETQLCVPEVALEHIEFWEGRGAKRLAAFEALRADLSTCQAFDNHLADRGVVTTRRLLKTATHRILRQVFDTLGIDLATGTGAFDPAKARAAMNAVLCSEVAIEEYNELPIGPYVNPKAKPKCPTKWVNAVLDRLGLNTLATQKGKARTRCREITPETWSQLNGYFLARQARDVSSLTIHAETANNEPRTAEGSQPPAAEAEGRTLVQVGFKALDTKVFTHLGAKYPAVIPLIERLCAASDLYSRDEVLGWFDEETWADIDAGRMSEWLLAHNLKYVAQREAATRACA